MRYRGTEDTTLFSPEQLQDHAVQQSFAESLLAIGNGTESTHNPSVELDEDLNLDPSVLPYANRIRLSLFTSVFSYEEAIVFVYPQGLNTPNLHKRAIMAATNDQVDNWNQQIQSLNPNTMVDFFSTDTLADIDDSVGNLKALITPEILHRYDIPNVPSHKLSLKCGDICLIIRTLRGCGNKVALSTNTRVKIVEIKSSCIRVLTLTKVPCHVNIPRIIFKFRLTSNESYYMHRKQYPLRLAYAMTINKSQGQEFESAVLDLSRPPFTHGLLYVGASRVRHSNNIRVFNCNNTGDNPAPVVTNIVFKDLLTPFD